MFLGHIREDQSVWYHLAKGWICTIRSNSHIKHNKHIYRIDLMTIKDFLLNEHNYWNRMFSEFIFMYKHNTFEETILLAIYFVALCIIQLNSLFHRANLFCIKHIYCLYSMQYMSLDSLNTWHDKTRTSITAFWHYNTRLLPMCLRL